MGVMENGTPEVGSHGMDNLKPSENVDQNLNPDPLTSDNNEIWSADQNLNRDPLASDNDKMNFGSMVMEARKLTGVQNVESNVVSFEESFVRVEDGGLHASIIYPNLGAETNEPQSVDLAKPSVLENAEVSLQSGIENFENAGVYPGSASLNPDELTPMQKAADDALDHLVGEDEGIAGQRRMRKSKLKTPVSSSYVLRSKSQEKSKVVEPDTTVKEGSTNGEKKRRGRKKKQRRKSTTNEFLRTRTHLRYLLLRIKYEQNLIDAYSAEGWKGQSLEKLKPEKELQRAKSNILRYKLRIRDLFQRLDSSLAVGKLPESLFDNKGEIDSEDIFCAKCSSKDVSLDNDIILCDGACERGFHQFCLDPPLLKEDIPPGDEGWLCPGCDCKVDCINILKDSLGTAISLVDSWEKIFPEAAAAASGKQLEDGFAYSSDDSEDDDFDPDKPDLGEKVEGEEPSSDESDYFSASEAASPKNENYLGLPSDESEDDDFDPAAPDPEKELKQSSSSSDFTSDSEDLGALLDDASAPGEEENSKVGKKKRQSVKDELSYLMENSEEPVSGKRRVERLDYKKLNDETFKNSSSESSDEDFIDDTTTPMRRKRNIENIEKTSLDKTPITEDKMDTSGEKPEGSQKSVKRTRKNSAKRASNDSATEAGSSSSGAKRAHRRLGEAVTQRLYQSFSVNQYLEKDEKEKLANELGLTVQQVTKWFENARFSFHHRPRKSQPASAAESAPSNLNVVMQESVAFATPHPIAEVRVGDTVTNNVVESSGKQDSRKRKARDDLPVTSEAQEQNAPCDLQSPQTRPGRRRTRSNNDVA